MNRVKMEQADQPTDWSRDSGADASEIAPASPCVRRCTLDPDDLCVGCGRMLDEILEWAGAPIDRKIAIRSEAAARLEQRRLQIRSLRP
jgi:predicted Fe-S protein YdhL (DUF1289 family)